MGLIVAVYGVGRAGSAVSARAQVEEVLDVAGARARQRAVDGSRHVEVGLVRSGLDVRGYRQAVAFAGTSAES